MTVEENMTINNNDLVLIVNAMFVFNKAIFSHFVFLLMTFFKIFFNGTYA